VSGRSAPALGSLRERVELQTKTQTIDGAGGHQNTFVSLATVWARVSSDAGSITALDDARTARISHTVVVRFRSDLQPGDRIIYRTEPLEIISAEDLNGRRAYLSCNCRQTSVTG